MAEQGGEIKELSLGNDAHKACSYEFRKRGQKLFMKVKCDEGCSILQASGPRNDYDHISFYHAVDF